MAKGENEGNRQPPVTQGLYSYKGQFLGKELLGEYSSPLLLTLGVSASIKLLSANVFVKPTGNEKDIVASCCMCLCICLFVIPHFSRPEYLYLCMDFKMMWYNNCFS